MILNALLGDSDAVGGREYAKISRGAEMTDIGCINNELYVVALMDCH
jgi:hypothetical protein